LESCERERDLGEPALAGGNIGDECDSVNPALEPEGDGGKCTNTGEGCANTCMNVAPMVRLAPIFVRT
jgi:hypothetical protein